MSGTITRDAEGTVTGNTYDKYGSTNPVVRRLLAGFERTLGELFERAAPRTVLAALGILGDLLSGQRITLQRIFERIRRVELELEVPPSHYEPGARQTGQTPTTGAHAGGRGHIERGEGEAAAGDERSRAAQAVKL